MNALEQAVYDILIQRQVAEIRFSWNGFTVTGIERLARLIPRRLHVAPLGADESHSTYHYVARGPRANTLLVDPAIAGTSRTRQMEAAVVHEATHALLDLHRFRGDDLDSEAMGYVAQALYHVMTATSNPDNGGIHMVARQIAQEWQAPAQGHAPPPLDRLRLSLITAIATSGMYSRLVSGTSDGRFLSTRRYRYNGI